MGEIQGRNFYENFLPKKSQGPAFILEGPSIPTRGKAFGPCENI
jgi:hypothetical protein